MAETKEEEEEEEFPVIFWKNKLNTLYNIIWLGCMYLM